MSSALAGLPALISSLCLDIIYLQEVKISSEQLKLHVGKLGFDDEVNIDEENISKPGTGLVWRKTLPVTGVVNLVKCRAQVASLGLYMLLNIYAPSGSDKKHERNEFFGQKIFNIMSTRVNTSWLMGGDYNFVVKKMDIEGGVGFSQKVCPAFNDLLKFTGLCDAFRHEHPQTEEFTFFRPGSAPSRLDRFYVPGGLLQNLSNVCHVSSLSDHCGVMMTLKLNVELLALPPRSCRRTYWKLNCSILGEEDFMPSFARFWRKISQSQELYDDIAVWWDQVAKPEIRDFCTGFSVHRNVQRNNTKKFLFSYLKVALSDKNWNDVAMIKEKLNTMLKEDAMGVVVRSRFKQNAEEEKASLYHAAREVKNAKNNISRLKIDGNVVEEENLIEDKVLLYFGALFNGHHNVKLEDTGVPFVPDNSLLDEFLDGLGVLGNEDRDSMHEDITEEELEQIIKDSDNNKSPGLDGLSYEFYKTAWPVIKGVFTNVLQSELNNVKLIESNRVGATRLASKVDGVPSVDELRLITLLNCD